MMREIGSLAEILDRRRFIKMDHHYYFFCKPTDGGILEARVYPRSAAPQTFRIYPGGAAPGSPRWEAWPRHRLLCTFGAGWPPALHLLPSDSFCFFSFSFYIFFIFAGLQVLGGASSIYLQNCISDVLKILSGDLAAELL